MKILLLGDVHLGNYPKFGQIDSSSLPIRLQELKEALDQVLEVVVNNNIKHIEFAGDFFHSDKAVSIECLNVAKEFFNKLKVNNVSFGATRGNHDLCNKVFSNSYQYSLSPFLNQLNKDCPVNVYRLHYDLDTIYEDIVGYDLVVAHKMPSNSKSPANYTFEEGVDWKELSQNNKMVVFGHNHHAQKLSENCYVLGSLTQLTFGDTHESGVWIYEDGKISFVPIKSYKFLTVESDKDVKDDGNYYRVLGESKLQSSRVIAVKEPTYYEQQIKGNTQEDILKEWLKINEKDESYFDLIKDDIKKDLYNFQHIPELRLKEIHIKDFGPFIEAHVNVDNGLTLIEGKNEGFSSNGSGKSFLCDSIYYTLYGETTKGVTGDDVIRKYPEKQKDCEVTLLIDGTNVSYKVKRSRKSGLSVFKQEHNTDTWVDLTEGFKLKESQEVLLKVLGFDKIAFTASTYFNQDQLLLLTRLGTSEKSSIITTLLGFDGYDKLGETFLSRINDIESQKSKIEFEISNLDGKETTLNDGLVNTQDRINKIVIEGKDKKVQLSKAKELLIELSNKVEVKTNEDDTVNIDALKEQLKQYENELLQFKNKETTLEQQLESVKKESTQDKLEQDNINLLMVESGYKSDIQRLQLEINSITRTVEGTVCNHCGSPVTAEHKEKYIEERQIKIDDLKKKKEDVLIKISKITEDIDKQKTKIMEVSNLLLESRKLVNDKQKQVTSINNKIQEHLTYLATKTKQKSEKEKQELIVNGLERELNKLRSDYKEYQGVLENYKTKLSDIKNEISTKTVTIKELTESIDIVSFWKDAISYKGIKSLLLSEFCNQFNNILKDYISEISNGIIFAEFSPISTTKAGESRNKLDLRLEIGGIERAYESLSGGEKRRVDIATCLAFSKWIQKRYNLSTSLLGIQIFDELFDGLDNSAEDCIAPILQREANNKAVFVVSHTRELSSYADRVITVQKRNMIAEIV